MKPVALHVLLSGDTKNLPPAGYVLWPLSADTRERP